jgi:hypothetical protein
MSQDTVSPKPQGNIPKVTNVRSTQFLQSASFFSECARFAAEMMIVGEFRTMMECLHGTDLQRTSIRSPDRYTGKRQPNRDTPMPEMLHGMGSLVLDSNIDEAILS